MTVVSSMKQCKLPVTLDVGTQVGGKPEAGTTMRVGEIGEGSPEWCEWVFAKVNLRMLLGRNSTLQSPWSRHPWKRLSTFHQHLCQCHLSLIVQPLSPLSTTLPKFPDPGCGAPGIGGLGLWTFCWWESLPTFKQDCKMISVWAKAKFRRRESFLDIQFNGLMPSIY